MDCRKIQEKLLEYQQDRLPRSLKIDFSDHLEGCPECRSSLEDLKLVDAELDRFGEISSSPYFDQKLNVRLNDLARQSWHWAFFQLLKQPYVLSFVFLFLATASIWIGFRHQQASKLKTLEDVIRVQEKYLGSESPAEVAREEKPTADLEPKVSQTPVGVEQVIPDQDQAVIENMDLLENYDTIKNLDLADSQASVESSSERN